MATSLLNETSSASLVELSSAYQLSGSQNAVPNSQSSNSKSSSSHQKSENLGLNSNQHHSATATSSSNQGVSTSQHKGKQSDSHYSQSAYSSQTSALIQSNSGIGYPFLYPNSIFPGLAQSQSQAQYNYQSTGSASMQSNSSSSSTQNNRRGGKKKAPATQTQNPEVRMFFNLRRRDSQIQSRGSSHFYKPKNPPSLIEWFKKLSVEERVNALSTVSPHLTETFIIMHQRIDQRGQSTFALRDRNSYIDSKYYQQQYILPYPSFPQILTQSPGDSLTPSFDDNFYQRQQNQTELDTIRFNEKDKINAEQVSFHQVDSDQEILKNVRLTQYFEPLDTLTVSEELVSDADAFFALMASATNNQAFSQNCQFVFDQKTQQNMIEFPHWFKPRSFHSFTTWIIVSLEENLWAQQVYIRLIWYSYNYDNNINMGTVKANELSSLFREKTDRGAQDVEVADLSKFWREMSDQDKKALINQLQINAIKEVEQHEAALYQSGGGYQTKSSKNVHSKNMQYSVQIKEKQEKSNAQIQTEIDLKYYIDQSQRQGFEQDLINQLIYTKFGNTHQRQVLICKIFLDLIKKKYKDDLMENLLLEETVKQNKPSAQPKKKKKKPNQSAQVDKVGAQIQGNESVDINQEPEQTKMKMPRQKKGKQFEATDKTLNGNMSSSDINTKTIVESSNFAIRKKKKGHGQGVKAQNDQEANQGSFTLQQDSYSCDEKDTDKIATNIEVESEVKSSSQGVSNLYEKTTAHQSNNSNTNSQETISSSVHKATSILQIQSSKSLDLNPVSKSKSYSNSTIKQGKQISKVESKNLQILQSSQNSETGSNHKYKTDKKMKQSTATNACSDNIIFSEDDRQSKKLRNIQDSFNYSESDHENIEVIKQYVLELTNAMITEVCNRAETSKSSISPQRNIDSEAAQNTQNIKVQPEVNQDLYKLSALPESTFVYKKRSFYKKNRKESTNQNQQNDTLQSSKNPQAGPQQEKRKISFNNQKKSFKDDKKYSEDQNDNISNAPHHKGTLATIQQVPEQISSHNNEMNNGLKRQRKNFGTNLQTKNEQALPLSRNEKNNQNSLHSEQYESKNEWAKGTVKQPDPQQKPKGQNQVRKQQYQRANLDNSSSVQTDVDRPRASNTFSQKDFDTISTSTKDDQSVTDSQQQKKRRNKRKGKVNDAAELMNNFMKNLQTTHEEVKHIIEPKNSKDQANATYKKRNQNNPGQTKTAKPQNQEDSKQQHIRPQGYNNQQQQQQYKQKQQVKNQTTPVKETPNEIVQNPQHPIQEFNIKSEQFKYYDNQEDEKNPELKQNQAKSYNRVLHKNHQRNQNNRQQKRQAHPQPSNINEDCESVQSNRADCISNKSSKSHNEKILNNDIQQQKNKQAPFRVLQFTTATDWDNTSLNDLTGTATTNTAADTSMENYQNHAEEAKDHIVIEDQSSHIQVSLTDSIDAKNLLKNNTLAFTLQQFSTKFIHQTMSQTLQEMQEASMIPPQVQSPCSNLSSSAQIYTPSSYGHYNQVPQTVPQQFNLGYDFKDQRTQGYQSYQNTPSKSSTQQRNPFKPQNLQLSSQVSQQSQDGTNGLHYRTPPQLSKKANLQTNQPYSNNGMVGGGFKKNSNGPQSNANSKQYQVKDYHQPPKQNHTYQPQIQPMAQMMHEPQFIHQFSDPSQTYYHDQSMMMPLQMPLTDPYYPKYQSQVFHYDDKSMLQMNHQPNFYPQPQMHSPFTPGVNHQADIAHNPYNYNEQAMGLHVRKEQSNPMDQMLYKRPNQGNFYDQSQDLILQIFNSIKFNQQSLSPIPQMMASPPPLFDLQSSTNSFLDPSSSGPQRIDSQIQMTLENAFYEKLDQDIYSYVQNIQTNLDLLKPERDFVFDKIQSVANKVFEGQSPKLELFGSLITGLALESSDMDLAVTGLYMEDRFAVIIELNKLASALSNWQVLECFKCIETASIPVIKMKVDIQKLRDYEMTQHDDSSYQSRPLSEQSRYLSIDITFDDSNSQMKQSNFATPTLFYQELMGQNNITKTHLGLQSCALVQYYIANYQNLKEVSILLKRFLALHNFNSPYYAYMNYFELRQNMNLTPSRLLMGFLDFYGNYFDPNSLGINVYNDGSFYQLNSLQDSNFVILDPLNLQNNTTRNSYLTKEILQKFQCAFNNLKSLTLKNPQLRNAGLSSKPALEKANSQDQNSSIPNEKMSPHASDHQTLGHQDWQVGVDQAVIRVPEETEACQLAKGESVDQHCEEQPFSQINLLETFFAGVAQPVAASDGQSSDHQEPMTAMVTSQSAESIKAESLESQGVSQKV